MTIEQLLQVVQSGGVVGLLALFIYALHRKWIVLGWQYDAMEKERDEYKAEARANVRVAEKAADTTARAVEAVRRDGA